MIFLWQISYFTLLAVLLGFVALVKWILGHDFLPVSIIYLFSLCFLPYIYLGYKHCISHKAILKRMQQRDFFVTVWVAMIIYGLAMELLPWEGVVPFVWLFLLHFILRLDSRWPFIVAGGYIIYVILFVSFSMEQLAESLSISAYYFLILGILLQFVEMIIVPKVQSIRWKKLI